MVALGYANAGVFANDDDMYARFNSATAKAGEKMWRMPLDDEYKEQIRSSIADIMKPVDAGVEPSQPRCS